MKIICIDRRKRFRYTYDSFIIYRVIYRKTIMKFKLKSYFNRTFGEFLRFYFCGN